MSNFAARISSKTDFTANGTFTVADGAPVRVQGFILSNDNATSSNTILFEVKNGSTVIQSTRVGGIGTVVSDIGFIADQGLSVTVTGNPTNASVTFFHSHPGN